MKLSKRCLFTIAALLGLALLPVPAQAQALADIEVTKAITGIDADGDPTNGTNSDGFEIDTNSTNPSIDEWLDGMVPPFTVINFRVELTVNSPAGLDLKEVVVKDNCGSELSVVCVPMTFGVLNLDCHILPASGGRRLIWQVGPLGTGTATLTVIATTNQNPGGAPALYLVWVARVQLRSYSDRICGKGTRKIGERHSAEADCGRGRDPPNGLRGCIAAVQ